MIPSVIVGTVSYEISSQTVQKKVNESNIWALSQAKNAIETQLVATECQLLQLYESAGVQNAKLTELSGTNFQTFQTVQSGIINLVTAGYSVNDVILVNFAQKWAVNNAGVNNLDEFEEGNPEVKLLQHRSFSSKWVDPLEFPQKSSKSITANSIFLVQKPAVQNDPLLLYLAIPYSSLHNMISNSSNNGSIMVLGSDGCVLESKDPSNCGRDISSSALFQKIQKSGRSSGTFQISMNGSFNQVSYIKSEYNNWIYLTAFSVGDITHDSNMIRSITIGICCGTIFLACLLAFIFSGKIYAPVQRIYNTVSGNEEDHTASRKVNELVQIEKNVSTLLHTQSKLKIQIWKQADQLNSYFVTQLLAENLDQNYIDAKLKLFGYPENPPEMFVFVTHIDTYEETQYSENDNDLLLYAINNIMSELFDTQIVLLPIIYNEAQITIVEARGTDLKEYSYQAAKKAQQTIREALGISVSIGISNAVSGYRQLRQAYGESMDALAENVLLGQNMILFIDDVRQNEKMKPVYPAELEKDLLDAVRSCDRVRCTEMLHQFMENVFNIEANRHEYRIFLQRLLLNLTILQKEICNGHIEESFQRIPSEIHCKEKTEAFIRNTVVETIITQIEKSEGNRFKKICDEILSMIHREYDTKITLESCAERLNYHPSYIRRVLKKEMGINFSEYLLQYRINISKKWLIETEMKVSDIAERLHYKNTENFIRSFKKATGVTPGQYRETKG